MTNPDYDMNLWHWQDRTVEHIPKDIENRDLGFVMEAAGDIFRELAGRQQPDDYYIGEKVGRIEKTLAHPVDREEVFASLSEEDQDRVDEYKNEWFVGVKGVSPRLTAIRNLNIALADQNKQGVRFNLRRFKEEWHKQAILDDPRFKGSRPYGAQYRRPVHVRDHRRRST